jgi:hypothetical protein
MNDSVPVSSGSGSPPTAGDAAGVQSEGSCWNATRLSILGWLKRTAPSLGELYEGAVQLFCHRNIPGWTRMLCHAVREVGNELPNVITGTTSGMLLQHTNRVGKLLTIWKEQNLPTDGSIPGVQVSESSTVPDTSTVVIPHGVYVEIAELMRDHEQSRQVRVEAATQMFGALLPDQKHRDAFRPVVRQWRDAVQWFVGKAHDSKWTDADLDLDELARNFEIFETPLAAALQQFFTTMKELDEILEDANS